MQHETQCQILSEYTMDNLHAFLKFQLAKKTDLEEIVRLYKRAILKMDEQNIPQWDEVYPDRATLEDDVKKKQMFVGKKNGKSQSALS